MFTARATDAAPEIQVPRGKVTGGSSSINGEIFLRGLPEDFDSWAGAGNPGWTFAEVLPYLCRMKDDRDYGDEPFHGQGGPIGVWRYATTELLSAQAAFERACLAAGFQECADLNAPTATGVGPYPLNSPDNLRVSTAVGYLPAVRALPNLTVHPDAVARRVLFRGSTACAVEVETGGVVSVIAGEEIVLCAGAIGSPQLLLCSGIGPATELVDAGVDVVCDLPGVGQNLQDHPVVRMTWTVDASAVADPEAPGVQTVLRYTAGSNARDDMWINPFTQGAHFSLVAGINMPAGRGVLRMRSANVADKPVLDYNFLEEAADRTRLSDAMTLCTDERSLFEHSLRAGVADG
jgi:choline dehydrogenase